MALRNDYTVFTSEMDTVNFSQPDHEQSEKNQSKATPTQTTS